MNLKKASTEFITARPYLLVPSGGLDVTNIRERDLRTAELHHAGAANVPTATVAATQTKSTKRLRARGENSARRRARLGAVIARDPDTSLQRDHWTSGLSRPPMAISFDLQPTSTTMVHTILGASYQPG